MGAGGRARQHAGGRAPQQLGEPHEPRTDVGRERQISRGGPAGDHVDRQRQVRVEIVEPEQRVTDERRQREPGAEPRGMLTRRDHAHEPRRDEGRPFAESRSETGAGRGVSGAEAQRERARGPLAGHVVVEIAEQRLVFPVDLAGQGQQQHVEVERAQPELLAHAAPRLDVGQRRGRARRVARGAARGAARGVVRCRGRRQQLVHALVADVETAQLVERERGPGPQPPDLAVQARVEPAERLSEPIVHARRGAHECSSG